MRTISGTIRTVIPVRPGKQLLQPVADLLAERIGHARSQIRQCVVVHYPPYLTVIDTEIAFLPHVKKTYIKRVGPFPALSDPPPLSETRLPQDGHADALYGRAQFYPGGISP